MLYSPFKGAELPLCLISRNLVIAEWIAGKFTQEAGRFCSVLCLKVSGKVITNAAKAQRQSFLIRLLMVVSATTCAMDMTMCNFIRCCLTYIFHRYIKHERFS